MKKELKNINDIEVGVSSINYTDSRKRFTLTTYDVFTFTCVTCRKEYAMGMDVSSNRDFQGKLRFQCVYCWNIQHDARQRVSVWERMLEVIKQSKGVISRWEV